MANLSAIKLPNGITYNLKDNGALQLTGGSVTGPVSFGDSVSIDEATIGDLVVNGSANFTNNLQANTINGVTVGSSPKFTDTTYSSLAAASGGTAVSLVTTGEKYTWNSKTSNTGTVTSVAISNGGGLSVSGSPVTSSGTITISHADTSSQTSSSNSGRTYIQSLTLDTYGHVTGISTATETVTNTDEKLRIVDLTSGTQYYPLVGTPTSGATGEIRQYDKTGFKYKGTDGTTSAVGSATLELGNSTASGTAGNKQAQLIMYGSNAKKATITLAAPSADIALALPTSAGTLALTSQIPDISGKADKSATVSTVAYDSTNKKITKTINGTTSDVVTVATLKTALGSMPASDVYSWAKASSKPTYTASEVGALASNTTYVSTITTTAGAHTAISNKSGAVSFNVPTKTSHLTNDSGFIVKNSDNSIYTNIAHTYIGSTTGKPYWKITIPNIATRWTIITLYFNIQENYATGAGGKLIVNGYHGSTSPYTWSGLTFSTIGFLSHSIQVYASGGDTFYIGGLTSGYFNIDLEKVLVADSARSVDISGTTIERVAELPSEYSTASFRQNQYVGDAGNGTATTFAYSKTGLDSTSWLAAWNGYELRAISPSNITAGSVAWSNVSSKPTATGSKVTGITASTTATKTTLGTAFTIPNVTSAGSASTWAFEDIACDDITGWSAGSGSASISGAVDSNDSTQLNITISHTHTAPTLNYTARTVSSKKSGANGTAPTLGTAFTVPNVTGNTSATVSVTDPGHTHSI